jgi:hypothetical protein
VASTLEGMRLIRRSPAPKGKKDMRPTTTAIRALLALLLGLACATAALGSSATFVVTATGIELGKPEEVTEKDKTVTRYSVKAEVGKPFTLTAQGRAYGRGDTKGQPTAPDSGEWSFDGKAMAKGKVGKKADESEVVVTLTPSSAGKSIVRFTGKVLGYERNVEVVVEAVER